MSWDLTVIVFVRYPRRATLFSEMEMGVALVIFCAAPLPASEPIDFVQRLKAKQHTQRHFYLRAIHSKNSRSS